MPTSARRAPPQAPFNAGQTFAKPVSRKVSKNYAPDGSYIPQGGGSRGWHDNQGVARNEMPNQYRYREVIDEVQYKLSGLEQAVWVNNRGEERKQVKMHVRYGIDEGLQPQPGLCLDISLTGAKIRVGKALKEDSPIQLDFVVRDDILRSESSFLVLDGKVVWNKSVNPHFRNPRYDCGIEFDEMELEQKERLSKVLMDQIADLLHEDSEQALEL